LKFQGKSRPEKSPGNGAFAAPSGAAFCSSGAAVFIALSAHRKWAQVRAQTGTVCSVAEHRSCLRVAAARSASFTRHG
jgi:hypothetical protein